MKKEVTAQKNKSTGKILLTAFVMALCVLIGTTVYASERKTVKVAFFPMEGYHNVNEDGSLGGMDVAYLETLSSYVNWKVEYVPCDSWEDALRMLYMQEVDLVGSAQYSAERDEVYDYADIASGYTFGAIVTTGDSQVAYEDFQAMENMTFGMVEHYVRSSEFMEYLYQNGISEPTVKQYISTAELHQALNKGEIDAYVHTFTEVLEGQRIIGRFAPRPFYYITYPGNEQVLGELNQAIVDLKMNQPELESELMNRYYYARFDKALLLTTQEKQYITEKKQLAVGYLDNYYPFSYVEDGEFKGLSRELLESGLNVTGLSLEYKLYATAEEAREALKNGEIDMFAYSTDRASVLNESNLRGVCEYAQIPLTIVTDKSVKLDEVMSIATVSFLAPQAKMTMGDDCKVMIYNNLQDCMNAAAAGAVDAVFCDGYFAEHNIRTQFIYGDLQIESVLNGSYAVSLAIRQGEDLLANILSKSISAVDSKMINEYMLRENIYPLVSITNFIKDNSMIIICILVSIIILIIYIVSHMLADSKKIQKLMYKDTKMDIWNMNYFTYWGERKLLPERKDNYYAIVYMNLSKFRRYNMIYGWSAGERLLESMAKVLVKQVDADIEVCARNQGDRFALLLCYREEDKFMERLLTMKNTIEERLQKESGDRMQLQMGVYMIPDGQIDIQSGINCALQTLEFSDGKAGNGIMVYDESLKNLIKERHEKEKLLESVEFNKDFVAFYQPKVDIRDGHIVGAEALVRFKDPTEGGAIKSPFYFVPYYEQTGQILELDFFIMECVCKLLQRRMEAGLGIVPISCNFSRIHFTKAGFIERFEGLLNKYEISKELIEVEVTETLVMEEMEHKLVKDTFAEMKKRGIHLSIDDFGSGYSSLGIFEKIPASVVKMDRSFFLNQDYPDRQVKIMRGIVNLTEELDAQIVCEGVETEKDIKLMQEIGAYVAQGYYYSKPIPEDEFEEKLNQGSMNK